MCGQYWDDWDSFSCYFPLAKYYKHFFQIKPLFRITNVWGIWDNQYKQRRVFTLFYIFIFCWWYNYKPQNPIEYRQSYLELSKEFENNDRDKIHMKNLELFYISNN